ncbi:GNAT family acetyltransferase [Nitrincola sp. A-D6]|uniref:GNAT family N-acetyltransferase n=1 Tax=Nitrincola sp. A-D6 TaxID=1545442 RepID=UPI00051FDE3A|nr:GNAT family N-acetyltransferase [Nitrincola sp. A-D6]KGK42553.1 GNAT family acetyltransferase [Nitrincola sp. A-D6]
MITIVKADLTHPEHADALVQLLSEYARDPMGGGEPLAETVVENLVTEMQKRPHLHSFIGFSGDEPVALMNTVEGFSTFAAKPLLNIHDVVVSRPYRGQGISRLLFESAEIFAKTLGCCKLTLEVLEGNAIAKKAYSRLGYAPYQLDPDAGNAQFWEKKIEK